jgi:hypothetical protein
VIGGPAFFSFSRKLWERNGGGEKEVDLAIGKTNDRALFSFECVAMAFFFLTRHNASPGQMFEFTPQYPNPNP